uniref:Sulfhydryl oxidase n=1 Tax=Steinernema glaseri TaxID=37863 RepID=A0A1I7XWE0_9BILA
METKKHDKPFMTPYPLSISLLNRYYYYYSSISLAHTNRCPSILPSSANSEYRCRRAKDNLSLHFHVTPPLSSPSCHASERRIAFGLVPPPPPQPACYYATADCFNVFYHESRTPMVVRQRSVIFLFLLSVCFAPSAAIESLYAAGDNVLELDVDTFNATVYNQVGHLPGCVYFKHNSKSKADGERYKGDKYNVDRLTLDVAKLVHDDWMKQRPSEWPSFDYIDNSATLQDLWNSADPSALYIALLAENEPAEVGWATLIGFANDKRIRVAVASPSHPLLSRLNQDGSNAKLHIFKKGSDAPLASSGDTVTWEEIRAKITDLLEQTSAQQQAPAPVINGGSAAALVPVNFDQYKVQLLDLKSALGYMLYYEIARKNVIEGDNLAALKGWMHVLKKYVPGTTPIRRLFYRLDEWLQLQMSPISSEQWTAKVNEIQDALGHPLPVNATWVACKGSKSYLRGYTCGLWTLMHTVTVEAYKQDGQNPQFKPVIDVLEPFHQFIFHFLSCSECAKNFDKLTQNNHLTQVTRAEDVILWPWRGHNNVNKRLSGAAGDDPSFPKRQFPPKEICHECVDDSGNYDEAKVLNFMIRYYADIRTDEMANEYKMSEFDDGKLQKVAIKHLNPKFAAVAEKVDRLEEAEKRLQEIDASPQRRWKSLDAQHMGDFERPPSAYGSFFFIWLVIAALALLVMYIKYRQNRSKFWKTFYYYNDYKLCPWSGPSTATRKYIA